MIAGLIAGTIWFTLFTASHIVVLRLLPITRRPAMTNRLLLTAAAGMAVTTAVLHGTALGDAVTPWRQGGILLGLVWGGLTFAGLVVLYMPFYYTIVASLSVRSLLLLAAQPGQAYPTSKLRQQFTSEDLIAQRLTTMVANGFLAHGPDGQYRLTAKARRIAGTFAVVKRFWHLGAGG